MHLIVRKIKLNNLYIFHQVWFTEILTKNVSEDTECNPLGIYGALKFSGEKLVIAYNQVFDLPYTIIRPSALYGERCISRRVGQIFIENAIQNKPIVIDGDGSDKLDFTYINDLMHGVEMTIKKQDSKNQIFNITHGNGRAINELIEILKENFPKIEVEKKERDKLMPERGTLSIEKAKKLINYQPTWILEKGYFEYIGWYKSIFSSLKK